MVSRKWSITCSYQGHTPEHMLVWCSRSGESRRRKRKEEVREDAADRDAEEEERAAARQKRKEQAQTMAEGLSLLKALHCLLQHAAAVSGVT